MTAPERKAEEERSDLSHLQAYQGRGLFSLGKAVSVDEGGIICASVGMQTDMDWFDDRTLRGLDISVRNLKDNSGTDGTGCAAGMEFLFDRPGKS